MAVSELIKSRDERVDELEAEMLSNLPIVDCPVKHIFTPNLYSREIFMPAGSLVTSKIHKTEHPYVVSQGLVSVWIDNGEEIIIKAPFSGITKPGTRRVLFVWEDTIWTTFHVDIEDGKDVDKIEERIIEKHDNKKITNEVKKKMAKIASRIEKRLRNN